MTKIDVTPAPAGTLKPWTAPRVESLPRLSELTLQTGGGIPGGGGSGGSTVF
jgi:hypothetical protein